MIELFSSQSAKQVVRLQPAGWNYLHRTAQYNLAKARNYHWEHPQFAASQHIVQRIISALAVNWNIDMMLYYDAVDAAALRKTATLGLTSSMSQGHVAYGRFYGGSTPEIMISTDAPFSPRIVTQNWQRTQAVKVLTHGKTDSHLLVPDGRFSSEEDSFAVITVNIPMLAVQYRAFRKQQTTTGSEATSLNRFVAGYVLPNMLPTHLDQVLFNRIYRAAKRQPPVSQKLARKNPFTLMSYDSLMQEVAEDLVVMLGKTPQDLDNLLKATPSLISQDAEASWRMPQVLATYQVDWALTLARLRHFHCLWLIADDRSRYANQFFWNQLAKTLTRNNLRERWFTLLPQNAWLEAQSILDELGLSD